MKRVKPDRFVDVPERRHPASRDLVEKLKVLMKRGWRGRPLLVGEINNEGDLETIAGVHRATAAMELGIKIPVVILRERDLPSDTFGEIMWGGVDYEHIGWVLAEAGLERAAELMRREEELGGFYRGT